MSDWKQIAVEIPEIGNMYELLSENAPETIRRYYVHNGNGDEVWFPDLPKGFYVHSFKVVEI